MAICGGGDAGISEALYLANLPTKVLLIEAMPQLTATKVLQEPVREDKRIEIRCSTKVLQILGDTNVKAIEIQDLNNGKVETCRVDGVLVHVGIDPNTDYLRELLTLDGQGGIIIDDKFTTTNPYILAASDIRSGSPP